MQVLKHFQNKHYSSNLLGESLEELAKKCTAKTLAEPDQDLIDTFIQAVQSHGGDNTAKELNLVLKRRLQLDNAHKQWLAVHLVRAVFENAPESLPIQYRQDILSDVAGLATHPSSKTANPNNEAASQSIRKARLAALELLRSVGSDGQSALRSAAGFGAAAQMQAAVDQAQRFGGAGGSDSWPDLQRETQNCIDLARGHVELVQELILSDAADYDEVLVSEMMSEMVTFSSAFEPLLSRLASVNKPEAEAMMAQALEAFDMIETAQMLHNEVKEARAAEGGGLQSAAGPQTPHANTFTPQPQLVPQTSFDALGLGELQDALYAPPDAAHAVDPFAQIDAAQAAPVAAINPFGQPPSGNTNPFGAPADTKDPFAQINQSIASDPTRTSPAQPVTASPALEDPFAALATGGTPPPSLTARQQLQSSSDPFADALLHDLTKPPPKHGSPANTAPMRPAPIPPRPTAAAQPGPAGFSSSNPFATAAPPTAAAPAPAAADDEWDMFFKDRVASPSKAADGF